MKKQDGVTGDPMGHINHLKTHGLCLDAALSNHPDRQTRKMGKMRKLDEC